jgi:hypothetical protein
MQAGRRSPSRTLSISSRPVVALGDDGSFESGPLVVGDTL